VGDKARFQSSKGFKVSNRRGILPAVQSDIETLKLGNIETLFPEEDDRDRISLFWYQFLGRIGLCRRDHGDRIHLVLADALR
jgi:hypothetical protein